MPNNELMVRDNRFDKIETQLKMMFDRAMEFSQTRSNMQIEKFIACEEYTPITQYRSLSHNSFIAMQEVRRMLIDRERKLREIETKKQEIANSKDPHYKNYDLDIYEISRQMDEAEIRINGLLKEIELMERICAELEKNNGGPFTNEQFQAEEPLYWQKRFANQMHRSQIGQQFGIGEGNYSSYLMAIQNPILPNSQQQIQPFDISNQNAIATVALKDRPGVAERFLQEVKVEAPKLP